MIETFSSPTIDFKSAGATPIFTPTGDFVVTGVTFIGIDVTGAVHGANVNLGSNSPTYNSFVSGLHTSVPATGKYQFFSIGGTVVTIVPAGTPFEINVTNPDTGATTNSQRVDISGYYI